MVGITLSDIQFNSLVKGTKPTLSTDSMRPALEYIKLEVKPGEVTASSCNGYAASRVTLKNFETSATFTGYFRPLKIPKISHTYTRNVEITKEDKTLYITVQSNYGTIRYSFDDVAESTIDTNKYIDEAKEKNRFVGAFDADLFVNSLIATKAAPTNKNKFFMYGPEETNGASYFKSEAYGATIIYEGILLPLRT